MARHHTCFTASRRCATDSCVCRGVTRVFARVTASRVPAVTQGSRRAAPRRVSSARSVPPVVPAGSGGAVVPAGAGPQPGGGDAPRCPRRRPAGPGGPRGPGAACAAALRATPLLRRGLSDQRNVCGFISTCAWLHMPTYIRIQEHTRTHARVQAHTCGCARMHIP